VLRPLDPILAADFELGALAAAHGDPDLWTALEALKTGLIAAELPYELFSENAAAVASVIYTGGMLQGITTARFTAPRAGSGGFASVGIRVFAHRSTETSNGSGNESGIKLPARSSGTGLVILSQAESGFWNVDHFELDLQALAIPMERTGIWDPYGTPVQY
jgi:hypothetical protein